MIADSLTTDGIGQRKVLERTGLSERALHQSTTRLSVNQMIQVCANAAKLSRDPLFSLRASSRLHVSSFGMFGLAILSSTQFRRTIDFALKYHELESPLVAVFFRESQGLGMWSFHPLSHPSITPRVSRFLVELNIASVLTLHRDVMGASFAPNEVRLPFPAQAEPQEYSQILGSEVLFGQPAARLSFDATWLARKPEFGNAITYAQTVKLCDQLMEQLTRQSGTAGKVRRALMLNRMSRARLDLVASQLAMTGRTLRRKLHDENTSFRRIVAELRMHLAITYLRETDLAIQEIAHLLGFSEDASFRQAFRRWTRTSPSEARDHLQTGQNMPVSGRPDP